MCVCVRVGGGTCSTYVIHRYEGPRAVDVQVCWVYVVMHRYEGPRAVDVQVCWVYVVMHRYEGPRAVDVQCTAVLGVCSDTQIHV